MKRPTPWLGTLLLALPCLGAVGPAMTKAQEPPRPELVVLISIDQLRGDLLDRYRSAFTGGLKRLLDDGYVFSQASDAHAITETAPGHTSLSTGLFPSHSGIVANEWMEWQGGRWRSMYAVADADAPIVGEPGLPGRSPKNILRGGLADWIRAADPRARVVSISGKDRAAIALAGKARGQVYWIVPALARFVTSTYYASEYPDWVAHFNGTVMPAIWRNDRWTQAVPRPYRGLSRPDTAAYEGDGVHTAFPHVAAEELRRRGTAAFNDWAYRQPRQDSAVLLFAQEAVQHLRLGQRGAVDYLGISLSATDYVGHEYGPLSREQLDNLYRLDRELGVFFDRLDAWVGPGKWVVGFSADHGVMEAPEALWAEGDSAVRLPYRERIGAIRRAAREAAAGGGDQADIARRLARDLESHGLVVRAYTVDDLESGTPPDSFATLFRHSSYPGRAAGPVGRWGVQIRFGYHELWRSAATGADHGTPYWYDRWVPFILLGGGVRRGWTDEPARTVDLAPTLASLGGIGAPRELDGRVVYR